MDYNAYIQNNPALMQAFAGLRPQDMKYLTNKGYDLDQSGSISQPEYGQFHWQTYGQNEQRPYTPSGPAGSKPAMPYGSTSSKINPNMAPPSNFWNGDQFVMGAPGLQSGSQPMPQAAPQAGPSMPQTPQPVGSPMPASFAGGGQPAPPMAGSSAGMGQIIDQIRNPLTAQFNMDGMRTNPMVAARKQAMRL